MASSVFDTAPLLAIEPVRVVPSDATTIFGESTSAAVAVTDETF